MPKKLDIALPLPVDNLFSYLPPILPEGKDFDGETPNESYIGRRALVTLGKRTLTGIIVAESDVEDTNGLKKIIELLDESPIFSREMLDLTKWIAEYYLCSYGEALKAALPQGMSPKSVLKIKLLKELSGPHFTALAIRAPKRAELLKELERHNDYVSINYLEGILKSNIIDTQIEALENAGYISCERYVEKDNKPSMQKAVRLGSYFYKNEGSIKEVCDNLDKKAPKQAAALMRIFRYTGDGPYFITDLCKDITCSSSVLTVLQEKKLVEIYSAETVREESSDNNLSTRNELRLPLTNEQSVAVETIKFAMNNEVGRHFLIHGVTGSGKTLVYMHLINEALKKDRDALVLVPEISLTPQLIDRFRRVFPKICVVLHSRMTQSERYDAWRQVQSGRAKIVVGARSALFAPLKNLGIIIVDEEHEPSYKQDSPNPRYNARDCALMRGKIEGTTVVLGSATPSLESMYNAKIGRFELLNISERADGARLPEIKLIDTLAMRRLGLMVGSLSKELITELADRVLKKEGSIVFQNRRGFSALLECPDCGLVPMCVNCSVSLTYHKKKGALRCHYCGHTIPSMVECPRCGSSDMSVVGFGTQRIEDEIDEQMKTLNIEASIMRMDLDTTSKKGSHRKILFDFASGSTDILVGTQMVAKGLDFDRVTLVAVVNADRQLYFPDFRSGERTFQLLTQVAGRAGRNVKMPGKVLIQSSHPDHPAIQKALEGDYIAFYDSEITARKEAHYPPFSRFILIEFSGKDKVKVLEHSDAFYKYLPKEHRYMEVFPPTEPQIEKIRNEYRRIIIIKNPKALDPSGKLLRSHLKEARAKFGKEYGTAKVKVKIDIDSFASL